MGIDICHKYDRKVRRTAPKSEDPYLRVLAKLYRYLSKRVEGKSNFNKVRNFQYFFTQYDTNDIVGGSEASVHGQATPSSSLYFSHRQERQEAR